MFCLRQIIINNKHDTGRSSFALTWCPRCRCRCPRSWWPGTRVQTRTSPDRCGHEHISEAGPRLPADGCVWFDLLLPDDPGVPLQGGVRFAAAVPPRVQIHPLVTLRTTRTHVQYTLGNTQTLHLLYLHDIISVAMILWWIILEVSLTEAAKTWASDLCGFHWTVPTSHLLCRPIFRDGSDGNSRFTRYRKRRLRHDYGDRR